MYFLKIIRKSRKSFINQLARFYCKSTLSLIKTVEKSPLQQKTIQLRYDPIQESNYLTVYKNEIDGSSDDDIKLRRQYLNNFLDKNPIVLKHGINYLNNGKPVYGQKQNIFSSFFNKGNYNSYKHILAYLDETKLVVDFSYNLYMNKSEKNELFYHLSRTLHLNNMFKLPFSLAFTNVDKENDFYEELTKKCKNILNRNLIDLHDKSYCDLYPLEKLIYLSPHAKEELTNYDPSCYYIVGALVDKTFSKKLSHKKAEIENIRSFKLPIDDYVNNYVRDKNKLLPIYIVIQFLLCLKNNYSLEEALKISFKHRLKSKKKTNKNCLN